MNIGATGERGEKLAARLLRRKGYRILERNFQTRFGEIDLIARKGDVLVFVEVKTRAPGAPVSGRDAVDAAKQARVRTAALQYWQGRFAALQPRFDVVEVTLSPEGEQAEHIENAFA